MEENSSGVVYAIKNNTNGKVYIGSTSNFQQRISQHLSALTHHAHSVEAMQKDFDINGNDFSVSVLFNGNHDEAILLIEKLFMTLFQTRGVDSGYNYSDPSKDILINNYSFKSLNSIQKSGRKKNDAFREWLFNARASMGWTQLEVAKKLGVSECYYSYIENGTRQKNMDISLVAKISCLFNIPIERIVELECVPTKERKTHIAPVNKIKKLCEQSKISMRELERRCGIAERTINRWDVNRPSVDKIQKVADFFGVTVDELMKEE